MSTCVSEYNQIHGAKLLSAAELRASGHTLKGADNGEQYAAGRLNRPPCLPKSKIWQNASYAYERKCQAHGSPCACEPRFFTGRPWRLRIAVADYKAGDVKVLRPDGRLAHHLGHPGQGPGGFQRVGLVQWARGDSLFAYDLEASRLTVFAPESPHPRARTVSVSREDGFPMHAYVTEPRLLVEVSSRVPPSDDEPRYRRIRMLSKAGMLGDTLFTARRQ